MKKLLAVLLSALILCACCAGCGPKQKGDDNNDTPDPIPAGDELITDKDSIDYGFEKLYGKSVLSDQDNDLTTAADVKGARFLVNGQYVAEFKSYSSRQDIKMEFYNDNAARLVNASAGMAFTVPATEKLAIDYSLAAYRTQITLGESILTASFESKNPYGDTGSPWITYRDEWIIKWFDNAAYLSLNGLETTSEKVFADTETKAGYELYSYSIRIKDESGQIERPYYNIGFIREENDNINFAFFVMKSKADRTEDMKNILLSYSRIPSKGIIKNYYDAGEPEENPGWNDETKEYYRMLQTSTVQWGAFSYSMPGDRNSLTAGNGNYNDFLSKSQSMQKGLEEAWGHNYDIYPTYTHISWGTDMHYFPNEMANVLAGGNGKNGKPVLQFTYQFTTNNNNNDSNSTPMFDIMRGKYDNHFKRLAEDIKKYGKPVLFRLNNEMNTDWTSYCGMMTLCDPDIFQMTWKRLYNIFEEEGVDNCIWIWNPMDISCPYSAWGEDLCYNPGAEYIQLLGLTCYQMNNEDDKEKFKTFEKMYQTLYQKNSPAWSKYRAVISEFACGSGGAIKNGQSTQLGRHADWQAEWVRGMFENFNAAKPAAFAKQIAGAIWFNCDDSDASGRITNRLRIFDDKSTQYQDLADTIAAFREGFAV